MATTSIKSNNEAQHTPLMRQYVEVKNAYPHALVFFQVGDFYELFFEDAQKAASFLGIALTKRGHINGEPIPLCGVPVHAVDHYLTKLVRGGFNVVICDQLEEAIPGKVVKRGVTQVLTPGTLTDTKLLDEKSASYLLVFVAVDNEWAIVCTELLTGQLFVTMLEYGSYKALEAELVRFFPDEIILAESFGGKHVQQYFKQQGYITTLWDEEVEQQEVVAWLSQQFKGDVQYFLLHKVLLQAALVLYGYLKKNQPCALTQVRELYCYKPDEFLLLDAATQRNLEIVHNAQDGGRKNSLVALMDHACTSMGSRMIKKWLLRPLVKREAIEQRYDAIQILIDAISLKEKIIRCLQEIGDLERVVGRIALNRGHLHDYVQLQKGLWIFSELKALLVQLPPCKLLQIIQIKLQNFHEVKLLLETSLNNDATNDSLIKAGFDERLDRMRELIEHGQNKLLALERKEQEATAIASLKVRFNQVQGYYIEITKSNSHLVPADYIHLQTLAGRERFTTPALRQLEAELEQANRQISAIEQELFNRVKAEVALSINDFRKSVYALAHLDALIGFAQSAYERGYVRPLLQEGRDIIIEQGCHPVVAHTLGSLFIPNDTQLTEFERVWIITGPNMGGKSTYLRQVALICLLAQCGSFVPARRAQLPILDRIFTRIGAGDNVAKGKSTFLVEMEETAIICKQATEKSLVILDEVGRGTSTFDGLALAQAIIEYIYLQVKARCLFATHYHELTLLEQEYGGIVCYYAASRQTTEGILFLHAIIKGVAAGSFGLEVAKLAALPPSIIERARTILQTMQTNNEHYVPAIHSATNEFQTFQEQAAKYAIFRNALAVIDFNELSPKKAFDILWKLKDQI